MSLCPTSQDTQSLARRVKSRQKGLLNHPETIPVEVTLDKSCCKKMKGLEAGATGEPSMRFLVNRDLTVAAFMSSMRNRLEVSPKHAMFVLFNNIVPTHTTPMADLYDMYKDDAQILCCTVCMEATFG